MEFLQVFCAILIQSNADGEALLDLDEVARRIVQAGQERAALLHQDALLATHRVAPTSNPVCTRIYMVGEYNRTTQPTAKELALRERFTEVRAMVATRRKDLNKISQDQLDFIAQKDLATGKKTMNAYLWKVCGQEYDAAHNG